MGLIDFVKNAGAKIFGKDEEEEVKKEVKAPPTPEEFKKLLERRRAAHLVEQIEKHGFEVKELAVLVKGDVAKVSGQVDDQATREKVVLLVGNTNGIGQVDDQLEVVNPEPEAVYHTVERGDTLSGIAKKHYGNAMKYPVIFEANKPMLTDPDKIYPGQVLRIPALDN
jgi:nucleoid-associated protein YgaU